MEKLKELQEDIDKDINAILDKNNKKIDNIDLIIREDLTCLVFKVNDESLGILQTRNYFPGEYNFETQSRLLRRMEDYINSIYSSVKFDVQNRKEIKLLFI